MIGDGEGMVKIGMVRIGMVGAGMVRSRCSLAIDRDAGQEGSYR